MRKTCLNTIYELAKQDERVVFIGSDLSPGLLSNMKKEFPDRHYMEGVTEQNIIGMAAGLAMQGYIPYVNTIATFITRRCYEQNVVDLCLHDLPVRLIGNGGGLVYAPLGPTHLAIEDITIMRAIPNMTVVSACDADEMRRLMWETLDWPDPIYIRLAKGEDEIISSDHHDFVIGKAIKMYQTTCTNDLNVLLISTGIMTQAMLKIAGALEALSIDVTLLHCHTIKPLDEVAILSHAKDANLIVTAEENILIGGLGSAVTDYLTDALGVKMPLIKRFGIPDRFSDKYGSQNQLLDYYGLSVNKMLASIKEILDKNFALNLEGDELVELRASG
ncbi:MAG: transketolase [Gammaproteobacteria bacterium]|nr:MAG: transketolase [Gammaproteobacteria bacterium]